MKKFTLLPLLTFSTLFTLSSPTFAQVAGRVSEGPGFATLDQLSIVFANVVGVVATFAGFAALIMLLVGGFRYMVSRGDPKALDSARMTIFWAIAPPPRRTETIAMCTPLSGGT